jgi:hypothetical protein
MARDPEFVREVHRYLSSIGYNQSKYEYSKLEAQVYNFSPNNSEMVRPKYGGWKKTLDKAVKDFKQELSGWKLRMLEYGRKDDIQAWIPRDDAHAGWSFIETGLRHKGDYRGDLLQTFNAKLEQAKKDGSFNTIIIPGSRTQTNPSYDPDTGEKLNEYKPKTRLVSMIDVFLVLCETMFAGPLQIWFGKQDWYAGGKNDDGIYSVLNRYQRRHLKKWISLDYSKYDQSIPGWLIFIAFDVLEAAFDKSLGWDEDAWRIVKNDFVHKVFLIGDNTLVESHDGVPSGSMFTQIIDTVVNRLMIMAYFNSLGIDKSQYSMIIMGDDNLIYLSVEVKKGDILSYIKRNFGVDGNETKSAEKSCDNPPEFLSRTWTSRGVWRLPEILIGKLIFPENYRRYTKSDPAEYRRQRLMIIHCYINDFPLGMEWIDPSKLEELDLTAIDSRSESIKFTSGLMRYRLQQTVQREYNIVA